MGFPVGTQQRYRAAIRLAETDQEINEPRSEAVKAWFEDKTKSIEVFYLFSYSPRLSTDERSNAELKYAIGGIPIFRRCSG